MQNLNFDLDLLVRGLPMDDYRPTHLPIVQKDKSIGTRKDHPLKFASCQQEGALISVFAGSAPPFSLSELAFRFPSNWPRPGVLSFETKIGNRRILRFILTQIDGRVVAEISFSLSGVVTVEKGILEEATPEIRQLWLLEEG